MNDGTGQGEGTEPHGKEQSGGEEMVGTYRNSVGEREGEPENGGETAPALEPIDASQPPEGGGRVRSTWGRPR